MANLFFIHTPFQLFVAQQLVHQKNLMNNIMVYGYIGSNTNTLELYDAMIIDKLWNNRFFMLHINDWNIFQLKHPIKSYYRSYKTQRWLDTILYNHSISDIYFGDINNTCYQLLSLKYKKTRININFYEEGYSHYVNSKQASLFGNIWKRRIKALISDLFFYFPVWRLSFGSYLYLNHIEYSQLPIHKRYSICPHYHESFDERLYPSVLMSERVQEIVNKELANVKTQEVILFLSEPVDEVSSFKWTLELLTLKRELEKHDKQTHIVVKFHPRETVQKKQDILEVFNEVNLPYTVICEDCNIPVEFFLQVMDFKLIITFFCSTVFYNGYLYNKTKTYSLLPTYYELCKEYDSPFTKEVESSLSSIFFKQLFSCE